MLTLEYGSIPDDKTLELSADNLQARLHVAACGYLIPLLHLLGTAGRAFGLADLQIRTWQETSRDGTEVEMSKGKELQKPLLFNSHRTEASSFTHRKKIQLHHLHAKHRKHYSRFCSLNEQRIIMWRLHY